MENIERLEMLFAKLRSDNPFDFLQDHSQMTFIIHEILREWHARSPTGPFWMELVEPLTLKLSFASSSFESLVLGTTHGRYSDDPVRFPDLSSIYTLGRAQLEAYLTFFYLYIQPKSTDENKLRYWLYVVQSLTVRQTSDTDMLSQEMQKRKIEEANRIEMYKKYIEENAVFQGYSPSNKGRLLSGRTAKEVGWEKLMDAAKLKAISMKTYDLYANHAHCEYMSLIQLRAALTKPEEARPMIATAVKTSLMILSLFIRQLCDLLELKDVYNKLPEEAKLKMKIWSSVLLGESVDAEL
ncbi:hypothetical protein [Hymenobacter guriensis]|uniref:Uncharacterized protein n=1 Tax=Hymenobacter guriensis TaxID=2793065 RepID=A0ABS0L1M6_9BACT|nr:hypothetical protein [Hymenobacter guriensis]MBG8553483.1 hypothetical protein [Hymenobacter guriensis]